MKKKISLMVSVIMLLQILLPILTVIWESDFTIKSVAEEATGNGIVWTYTLSNGEATGVKPKNKDSLPIEVTIPSELDGHKVTSIGSSAFYRCDSLTSITIPEGVTSIGGDAFYRCDSLTSIIVEPNNQNYSDDNGVLFNKNKTEIIQYPAGKTETEYRIPEGVTSIGFSAFEYCDSLTSVTIPETVTTIGSSAFYNCDSLTNITIPKGVTSIGRIAFFDCDSLTSITIPEGVTSIGDCVFCSCDSLTSITVEPNNQNYSDDNGVLFNKNKTEIIQYPAGKTETEYVIPNSVTSIGRCNTG